MPRGCRARVRLHRCGEPAMTRILVTGSRAWRDRRAVVDALDDLLDRSCGPLTVVHGAAAGADGMAHAWAVSHPGEDLGIAEPHPAHWLQHGKQARVIPNRQLGALGA